MNATAGLAPTVNPVLPATTTAVPSLSPAEAEEFGKRSLTTEVETNAGALPAAYAAPEPAARLAAASRTEAAETFPVPPPAFDETASNDTAKDAPNEARSAVEKVVDVPVQAARLTVATLGAAADAVVPDVLRGSNDADFTKPAPAGRVSDGNVAARSPELDALMRHYADYYDVPEALVRRVAKRESTFNPRARNGIYMGLMQIAPATARGMGYRGSASGLLDAETNLKYAVRYLRGAFVVAGGNHDKADRLYQSGYYYHAKRMGLLDETGVGVDRKRRTRRKA